MSILQAGVLRPSASPLCGVREAAVDTTDEVSVRALFEPVGDVDRL